MKTILKQGYGISDKDLQFINDSRAALDSCDLHKDVLYSSALLEIFKNSITEIDHRLNWVSNRFENKFSEVIEKRFFLLYILKPVQEAKTYKEVLSYIYNQHGLSLKVRNSILLMINHKEFTK